MSSCWVLLVLVACGGDGGMVMSGATSAGAGMSAGAGVSVGAGMSASAGMVASAGVSAGAAGGGGTPAAGAPTFTRIWTEVLMLKGCAGQYCHGSGIGGLSLKDKRDAYTALVGVKAAGPKCASSGMLRVKPGDPAGSLLLDKLSHAMPSCGDTMPIGAKLAPNCLSTNPSVCTTEAELNLVTEWVLAGAPDN